jgi:hypothetical protein
MEVDGEFHERFTSLRGSKSVLSVTQVSVNAPHRLLDLEGGPKHIQGGMREGSGEDEGTGKVDEE